jgi:hypothetical protein
VSQTISDGIPARQLASCGDRSCEWLVDPIPRPAPTAITITLQPRQPRVTFIDHSKPNSAIILGYAKDILRERGVAVAEEIQVKPDASQRMPEAMLQSLASEPGLVLCGVSD